MSRTVQHIVIVGGGAAGWLTAGVIAAEHRDISVTLIESPDVKTIGVGEGTWPSMRDTLSAIGVSETELIRECDASFKQGSKFASWVTGAPDDYYYHPFVLPSGYTETNLVAPWLEQHADQPFADLVSVQPSLCEHGRAPKQNTTPEFAAVANYAYHLDAGKFGHFLQRHCTEQLGVRHLLDHVSAVSPAPNGDIASLQTAHNGQLSGDLFVDCTGFAALLIDKHFQVPFVSRQDVLFCDTALAVQVNYDSERAPIASQTLSTAQTAGWIWDIGLPTRRGIGYVYSSNHTNDSDAEASLWRYVRSLPNADTDAGQARKIRLNPGHRETFWHRNCVAVGISAGFIEPLEASALALIEMSAAMIRDELPPTRAMMDMVAKRFNDRFRYRWDRTIEFLKLHYLLSQRTDSAFWIDNRHEQTIPNRLQDLLRIWQHRPPSRSDFYQVEEIFPSASYQYVLYGMGFRPSARRGLRASESSERAAPYFQQTAQLAHKMLAALPNNRELIDHVRQFGFQKI